MLWSQHGVADLLATRIVNGGSGVCGSIPMLPHTLTFDEAKLLAAAILTL